MELIGKNLNPSSSIFLFKQIVLTNKGIGAGNRQGSQVKHRETIRFLFNSLSASQYSLSRARVLSHGTATRKNQSGSSNYGK